MRLLELPLPKLSLPGEMCIRDRSTVTYLYEGSMVHRDGAGNPQTILPGEVNWMTAGRGIVHSERSSPESRQAAQRLAGLQIWVGLPKAHEETDQMCIRDREDAKIPTVCSSLEQALEALDNDREFFRRQVVQVLVGRIAGVDLVLHAVQAGHHQGRERQVRVGQRVREARFDATDLRVDVYKRQAPASTRAAPAPASPAWAMPCRAPCWPSAC